MAGKRNAASALQDSTRGEAPIREFAYSNLTPEQSKQRAAHLLNTRGLLQNVQALTPEDQTRFIDKVDQAYTTVDPQDAKYVIELGNVCSATERLPTSATLSTGLQKRGNIAVASGGFTDIWRGEYYATQVAIKAFRIYPAQNLKEAKEILWKRAPIWKRLSHGNILPFRGVTTTLFQLALVYDWGHNGNISQYTASNLHASRASLLLDIAKGLEYLHSLDIPHGDLKGANIIIDQRGRARLTEYGLAPINSDPSFTVAATPGAVGSSRWLAPEIITPARKGTNLPVMESKAADVFAFGMVAMEVFTGKIPFEERKNEGVVLHVSRGGRPDKPENAQVVGLTDAMWRLLESCWQQTARKRPTMEEVVRILQGLVENGDAGNGIIKGPTPGSSRTRARTEAPQPVTRIEAPRPRTRTEAPQPLTRIEAPRPRTRSELVQPQPRTEAHRLRTTSHAARSGTVSEVVQQGARPDVVQRRTKSEIARPGTMSEVVQQNAKPEAARRGPPIVDPPPTRRKCFCGLF